MKTIKQSLILRTTLSCPLFFSLSFCNNNPAGCVLGGIFGAIGGALLGWGNSSDC